MVLKFGLAGEQEPSIHEAHEQQGRRPSAVEALDFGKRHKSVSDKLVTGVSP